MKIVVIKYLIIAPNQNPVFFLLCKNSGGLKLVHKNLYSRKKKKHKKIQADMRFFCTIQHSTWQFNQNVNKKIQSKHIKK